MNLAERVAGKMDRRTFINLAPEYYMLALYLHLQTHSDYYTEIGWQKDFGFYDEDAQEEYCYIGNAALRKEAVRLMSKYDAINIIHDPFGPTIWQKNDVVLEDMADQLVNSQENVFFRAKASGDPKGWLYAALRNLNEAAEAFDITSVDFAGEAVTDSTAQASQGKLETNKDPIDEWAPITIDQTSPAVAEATKRLHAATEVIEQDNGYSATYPQERDAVVADLKGGLDKLKSGVVSAGWMRRVVNGLRIGSVRFANTIKGQTIDGTLAALKDVVKSHMGHLFENLFSWWP